MGNGSYDLIEFSEKMFFIHWLDERALRALDEGVDDGKGCGKANLETVVCRKFARLLEPGEGGKGGDGGLRLSERAEGECTRVAAGG